MLINPSNSELLNETNSSSSKLIAAACALVIATVLLGGYFYLRNRHARQTAAAGQSSASTTSATALKGPAKLHVLMDEPLLKAGESLIGGTVKNVSNEELSGLSVELELWKRQDSTSETKMVAIEPNRLGPNQEGRYAIKLAAQEYASVRLSGLRSNEGQLAYTSGLGQQRPLEKTESKTVIVQKPRGRGGEEFINSPDNPARVP